MVAYSFKSRFVAPILAGTKAQTIRADRRRHARLGEEVQLYTGMRTKTCRLIGRATCSDVVPVALHFSATGRIESVQVDGVPLGAAAIERFAQADGFASREEMAAFWAATHGAGLEVFRGVLIRWKPLEPLMGEATPLPPALLAQEHEAEVTRLPAWRA